MPVTAPRSTFPSIVSLAGEVRPWDEVFTFDATQPHGPHNVTGYIVRATYFAEGVAHRDLERFGASDYVSAVQRARATRNDPTHDGYAVIDTLYACGDRLAG